MFLAASACYGGFGIGVNGLTIVTKGFADGVQGEPYSQAIRVVGGVPGYSFSVTSGALPPGVVLDAESGVLSGVPTAVGTFAITVTVKDNSDSTAGVSLTGGLVVHPPATSLTVHTTLLPEATRGAPYASTIAVSGGMAPFAMSVVMGSLPPGLVLNATTGEVAGVPFLAGGFSFTVEVQDSSVSPQVVQKRLRLVVTAAGSSQPATFIASRTSGVAPLSVFFDATPIALPAYPRKFHRVNYSWSFSDPSSRRPTATGPLAAHVFEHPGTYVVTCVATDPTGTSLVESMLIDVEDPDTVFAGADTVCFSNTNNFPGAPVGAQRITTTSFNTAMGYIGPGRRLLFCRGDTFTSNNDVTIDYQGPMLVGAFGAGVNPDSRGIYSNNPVINVNHLDDVIELGSNGTECDDLRIMDLNFVPPASGGAEKLVTAGYRLDETLLYRLKAGEFRQMVSFSTGIMTYYNIPTYELTTIADCDFWETSEYGCYLGGNRTAILGNRWSSVPTSGDQHMIRIPHSKKCIINGNYIRGAAPTKHCIKLHARTYFGPENVTEDVVIADNEIHTTTAWGVAMGTGSPSRDERVQNVIVERNCFHSHNGARVDLFVACQEVSIRNNVFVNDSTSAVTFGCVQVDQRGPGPAPQAVEIYHNTAYTTVSSLSAFYLGRLFAHSGGPVVVWNNLLYAPNEPSSGMLNGSAPRDQRGSLVNVNPLFVNPAAFDFSLQSSSPAVGIGVAAPVRWDFVGQSRSLTAPAAGAFER